MKLGILKARLCIDTIKGGSYEIVTDLESADRELAKLDDVDRKANLTFDLGNGRQQIIVGRHVCGVSREKFRDHNGVRIDLYQDLGGQLWLYSEEDESGMAWKVDLPALVEQDLDGDDDQDLFLHHATQWWQGKRTMSDTAQGRPYKELRSELVGVAAVRPGETGEAARVKIMPGVTHSRQAQRYLGRNAFIGAGLPADW